MEELLEQGKLALQLKAITKLDLDNWINYSDLYLFYESVPEDSQLRKRWVSIDNSITRMLNCGIRTTQSLTLYHGSTVPLKQGITDTVLPLTPNLHFARSCGEFIYRISIPKQTLCFPICDPKVYETELLLGRGNLILGEVNNVVIFKQLKYIETIHVVSGIYQSLDHYEKSIIGNLSTAVNPNLKRCSTFLYFT